MKLDYNVYLILLACALASVSLWYSFCASALTVNVSKCAVPHSTNMTFHSFADALAFPNFTKGKFSRQFFDKMLL